MTTKTIYVCDRCGEESEDSVGWKRLSGAYLIVNRGALLCPSCSERALEKPTDEIRREYVYSVNWFPSERLVSHKERTTKDGHLVVEEEWTSG